MNDYLGLIEAEGTDPDRTTQFCTHLYRVLIHPNVCSDVNGEYMSADFRVHRSRSKQAHVQQLGYLPHADPGALDAGADVASDVVLSPISSSRAAPFPAG